ncbi:MAG: 2-dehydropantoate 2-reductase [Treponema sp.]|nr:2-dehydropantoate 2-reductase [Treponema sp.]
MIESVSLIGMGALGILYGDILTEALGAQNVNFLADRSRVEKYLASGVYCNGRKCAFTVKDFTEKSAPPDLLIFAVKGTALDSAVTTARGHIGKNTIIISLLNGISSEEIIAAAFGKEHLIYCIAQGMDALRTGNRLEYEHKGELRIGLPAELSANTPLLKDTAELFDRASLPYKIETDIMHRMWSKWMLNVGVNQVVMVTKGTYATVQKDGPAREMMKSAMKEVIALSEKEKTGLTEKDMEEYVTLIDTLNPAGMPSMRQDGLAGRKTEVDMFSGTVLRRALRYDLPVPVNRLLYDTIKKMETEQQV